MSSAAAMVLIRHYFISRRYSVRCPTNTIALHIAQLLCYSEKDNLCSLLDSGREDLLLVEINNAKFTRPAVSSGEERGLLSRTAAGNRAYLYDVRAHWIPYGQRSFRAS